MLLRRDDRQGRVGGGRDCCARWHSGGRGTPPPQGLGQAPAVRRRSCDAWHGPYRFCATQTDARRHWPPQVFQAELAGNTAGEVGDADPNQGKVECYLDCELGAAWWVRRGGCERSWEWCARGWEWCARGCGQRGAARRPFPLVLESAPEPTAWCPAGASCFNTGRGVCVKLLVNYTTSHDVWFDTAIHVPLYYRSHVLDVAESAARYDVSKEVVLSLPTWQNGSEFATTTEEQTATTNFVNGLTSTRLIYEPNGYKNYGACAYVDCRTGIDGDNGINSTRQTLLPLWRPGVEFECFTDQSGSYSNSALKTLFSIPSTDPIDTSLPYYPVRLSATRAAPAAVLAPSACRSPPGRPFRDRCVCVTPTVLPTVTRTLHGRYATDSSRAPPPLLLLPTATPRRAGGLGARV